MIDHVIGHVRVTCQTVQAESSTHRKRQRVIQGLDFQVFDQYNPHTAVSIRYTHYYNKITEKKYNIIDF